VTERAEAVTHEHVHNTVFGERRFTHSHPYPKDPHDPNLAKRHAHSNGEHSHPHDHKGYFTDEDFADDDGS
jgi:hypothetical protein